MFADHLPGFKCCRSAASLRYANSSRTRHGASSAHSRSIHLTLSHTQLALTAAAPIFRGYLADVDCRWNVIAGSVDDRTAEERGVKPLKSARWRIPKSRYDSVDCYLSTDPANRPEYNDNDMPLDTDIKNRLLDHGIDDLLSEHVAHLFIRDPLVIFSETVDQDDEVSADHFEVR